MATRPVFKALPQQPYVEDVQTEFEFHPGFSTQQKQRSIASLQSSFLENEKGMHILEVSSKSDVELGYKLSAFNMRIQHEGVGTYCVESAFQSSKVFEKGGPFVDLLMASGRDAKRDTRLRQSGQLLEFNFFSRIFPLEPKTYFYDWLYASALFRNQDLLTAVVEFDAFTDIEFNPKKSINCQARSIAMVVGLWRRGILEEALETPSTFLSIGYPAMLSQTDHGEPSRQVAEQESLF